MRKSYILALSWVLALFFSLTETMAQNQICRIGFEYQMSYNENWGANRPVVLSVEPIPQQDMLVSKWEILLKL
ncbi:hypothetical protein [Porphyromonas gingivicanis]|uniref:hypothetical protein n=1 Tax=Porphyromonas gingivicanis TaxID=266762 RepID=UPI00047249AD|nr:hypothetical protein [Porphyromonas gingivicanis]